MIHRGGGSLRSTVGPTVTWLHLSDVHFCPEKTGWDAARVLRSLRRDLVEMQDRHGLHPDLIFFTGDLAFGHLPDSAIEGQFEEGMRFLDGVRKSFRPTVKRDRVFIVPGNHDVNRRLVSSMETEWLDRQESTAGAETISLLMRDNQRVWRFIAERLNDYRQCLERHGYRHLLADPARLVYAVRRNISGFQVGIAGFNTAWSCCREKEKGSLWLGRWQLETLRSALEECAFRIALTHHPCNWLRPEEDTVLRREVEQSFEFHLHGHEHLGWADRADRHVRIAAGACYEHSTMEAGYSFVRLEPSHGRGEVLFRRYDATGGGWVARNVHGKAEQDGRWPLKMPWLNPRLQQKVEAFIEAMYRDEELTQEPSFARVSGDAPSPPLVAGHNDPIVIPLSASGDQGSLQVEPKRGRRSRFRKTGTV